MSDIEPYGNNGHHGPDPMPRKETETTWRYGYRVDSDVRGPQRVGGSEHDLGDAIRAAKRAANEQREKLRQLGIGDAVVPWTQSCTRTVTYAFGDVREESPLT